MHVVGVERRVGGQESAQWRAGLELAKQGHIANLRVLAIDVVSAPADGAPRWASPAWNPPHGDYCCAQAVTARRSMHGQACQVVV